MRHALKSAMRLAKQTFTALLLFGCYAHGEPPPGYYSATDGKTGAQLRQVLHSIIRAHSVIPYSSVSFDTSDALKILDEDPANTNNVILLYAARSQPKDTFAQTGGWNREHMWPNSYGLDDRHPAYSDLFNLRAEDENVNSARGNKFYDVSATNDPSYRFPAHAEAPLCSTDSDSWEPPAAVKGDIARALFYMDIRYEGEISGEPELVLTENTSQIASTNASMGRVGTLLAWHYADPVSDAERLRNERIYTLYQHNRNPFVDHPEWVNHVFRPRLRIVQLPPEQVEFTWPIAFSNVQLQVNGGLGWAGVKAIPTRRGEEWFIRQNAWGNAALYRLR
jgi:serine protease